MEFKPFYIFGMWYFLCPDCSVKVSKKPSKFTVRVPVLTVLPAKSSVTRKSKCLKYLNEIEKFREIVLVCL